jgi:hypothetical protein
MTSKQSRKVAATRFVTSIDMWNLHKFPVDTLLIGLKSFIADCPASDLTKITSWRMPQEGNPSTSLEFSEPILCNLTSLHALEPSPPSEPQRIMKKSQIGFVLEKCTSLKQLYYRAYSTKVLEKYLAGQPKLQALAVRIGFNNGTDDDDEASELCDSVVPLFEQLQHRPKTVCILSCDYGNALFRHLDWAQDAERVILSNVSPPANEYDPMNERIEWFQESTNASIDRCWKLQGLQLDPFEADALPYVAQVVATTRPDKMGSAIEMYEAIRTRLPKDLPIHIWAAAYHQVTKALVDLARITKSESARSVVSTIARLLSFEVQGLCADAPDWQRQYVDTWYRIASTSSSKVPPFTLEAVEWAVSRIQDMCNLDEPRTSQKSTRSMLAPCFFNEPLEQWLFSDNPDYLSQVGDSWMTSLVGSLHTPEGYEMAQKLWSRYPTLVSRALSSVPWLQAFSNGTKLSDDAIAYLLSAPERAGFTMEQLLCRPDVDHFLVRMLSEADCPIPTEISRPLRNFIVASEKLVGRLHRRARILPQTVPVIAAWMYSLVWEFEVAHIWSGLRSFLDEYLVSRWKESDGLFDTLWKTAARIKYSDETTICMNLIAVNGVPDPMQRAWKVMVDPREESHEVLPWLDLNKIPIHNIITRPVDPQRLCEFYYARVSDRMDDVEVLASAATDLNTETPLGRVLMVPLLSEFAKQLQLTEHRNKCYPQAAKLISKWCMLPAAAEVVAQHFPDAVWIDLKNGTVPRHTNNRYISLLSDLVEAKKFESAYTMIRLRNGAASPLYILSNFEELESKSTSFLMLASLLSHCGYYNVVEEPRLAAIINKYKKEFDKLFSAKRDLPDYVMVGVWRFMMRARDFWSIEETFRTFSTWEPHRVQMLQRASAETLEMLRDSMDVNIITAYLSLMAAHNNWDGFLGSAVYLQKQHYHGKELQECLDVALMIAFYKMGSIDKAKKASAKFDAEFGPGSYFSFLGSQKIWDELTKQSQATRPPAAASPTSSAAAPKKKKKKGKSRMEEASSATAAVSTQSSTSSPSTQSAPTAAAAPEEPDIQYEPDTKPAKISAAPLPSSRSSEASKPLPSDPPAKTGAALTSGPAGLVYAACPICYDCLPDCGVMPCGHMFCLRCVKNLSACAICREPIQKWHRFFFSHGEPDDDE